MNKKNDGQATIQSFTSIDEDLHNNRMSDEI